MIKNLTSITTYEAGLLQAKAYRRLKTFLSTELKEHGLTMMDWALLGYVYDARDEGIRTSVLAELFNVEPSLMTNMINDLEKRELVVRVPDLEDGRAKRVLTTPKGTDTVAQVEVELRGEMKKWLKGVNKRDMITYMRVLKALSKM